MEVEQARELLSSKDQEEKTLDEAKLAIAQDEETNRIEEFKRQQEKKQEETKEFIKKIPTRFSDPYTRCVCGAEVKLTNKKGIRFVDELYRVSECPKCGRFVIDWINLDGAENIVELEPYVLQIKEQELKNGR